MSFLAEKGGIPGLYFQANGAGGSGVRPSSLPAFTTAEGEVIDLQSEEMTALKNGQRADPQSEAMARLKQAQLRGEQLTIDPQPKGLGLLKGQLPEPSEYIPAETNRY